LCEQAGFEWIPSDGVRKQLAAASTDTDFYTSEWLDRTYDECLRRTEALLFEGRRVVVDASFREESKRQALLACAARWRVPVRILLCRADSATTRERLRQRKNDLSEADWSVYERMAAIWEAPSAATQRHIIEIDTTGRPEDALAKALAALG
jgi:predicted kinase